MTTIRDCSSDSGSGSGGGGGGNGGGGGSDGVGVGIIIFFWLMSLSLFVLQCTLPFDTNYISTFNMEDNKVTVTIYNLQVTPILELSLIPKLECSYLLTTTIADCSENRGISLQQNHLSTKVDSKTRELTVADEFFCFLFAILEDNELFALLDSFEVDDDDAPLVVVAVVVFVAVDVVELSCRAVGMNILPVNDDREGEKIFYSTLQKRIASPVTIGGYHCESTYERKTKNSLHALCVTHKPNF
uniref:Uncharacterized protein n=1 Tax=Glossina palpalis gambiensis TaxID=67801 RepID=A0A1B0B586_9MUSC